MSHQVRSWFGASVPNIVSHPAVRALAEKWLQIKTERDPVLADFWNDADERFAANVILFLKGPSDYLYLHHGRYLRERIGFSMQGLTLSQLRTRVKPELMEIYDRSADEFDLTYFQSFADFQQDVVLWGRLCLPLRLSAEDDRLAILLYCHPIEDKASIFRTLFENSAAAIIIGAPILEDGGLISDAWIVAQNEQAGDFTGVHEHSQDDLLLRHVPLFAHERIWTAVAEGLDRGAALVTAADGSRTLTIHAEMVDEYVVVRITPASPPEEVIRIG